jgi:hypothetical protein
MSLTKVQGYNLRLDFGGKKIAGTTSDSFNIEGVRKESIMKSDVGNKQYENDGRAVTFSATLFIMHGTDAALMSIDDLRKAAAANTVAAYIYGGQAAGDPTVTGSAMVLKVGETSDSENFATATVDFEEVKGTGGFAVVS